LKIANNEAFGHYEHVASISFSGHWSVLKKRFVYHLDVVHRGWCLFITAKPGVKAIEPTLPTNLDNFIVNIVELTPQACWCCLAFRWRPLRHCNCHLRRRGMRG
jgi:hypothetical protein